MAIGNLTYQYISESFSNLMQYSSSGKIYDGLGTKLNFESGTSGSFSIPITQSVVPNWTATDGQFVFGTVSNKHYIYVYMSGA